MFQAAASSFIGCTLQEEERLDSILGLVPSSCIAEFGGKPQDLSECLSIIKWVIGTLVQGFVLEKMLLMVVVYL